MEIDGRTEVLAWIKPRAWWGSHLYGSNPVTAASVTADTVNKNSCFPNWKQVYCVFHAQPR